VAFGERALKEGLLFTKN